MNRIDYSKSVVNKGNSKKIQNVMEKAKKGEAITVGFIGGSITQGCLATEHENCYAYRVYKWWENKFPEAKVTYVNAGIGGTCSQFGVARAEADLLYAKPDFVITEFSVNDENTEHYRESYEGLIRRVLSYQNNPAVLIVHNVFYNNGYNAQDMHKSIGEHYDIPCVSMKDTIYEAVTAGKIQNREITDDDLHPNDLGHEMVASVIINYLESVYQECVGKTDDRADWKVDSKDDAKVDKLSDGPANNVTTEKCKDLPIALTSNRFEKSTRYRNMDIKPIMQGFEADMTQQVDLTDCFRYGWQGKNEGASLEFNINCKGVAVQYRRYAFEKAPKARVIIDGDNSKAIVLDGNFDETWGDKLELTNIAMDMEKKEHKIKVILENCDELTTSFYLVSIIVC